MQRNLYKYLDKLHIACYNVYMKKRKFFVGGKSLEKNIV